jgi:hypothetical protein
MQLLQGILITAFAAGAVACADTASTSAQQPAGAAEPAAVTPAQRPAPALDSAAKEFYREAAALAWRYMEENYQDATGFVNATPHWEYITTWDVGSQMLAFVSALELQLMDQATFDRRVGRMLQTLEQAELHRGAAFNKVYSTATGLPGDGRRGWSATDLGRLLIGLRVVAERHPDHAAQAERIVRRMNYDEVVRDGYLHGQMPGSRGQPWSFQEGRVGYEQYFARGFQLWGFDVGAALDLQRHGRPVEVMGVSILRDERGLDRIVSDPFIMLGIELGMPAEMEEFARNVLRLQEARYRQSGQVTIVNEDASTQSPHYFYYYCAYCNGRPFVVDISTPGQTMDGPRWVSTKGAFGWHALMPSDYTRKALDHVMASRDERHGWASGVYEGNGRSTEAYNINTAAVILQVAAYQLRGGRPLILN